MNFCEKHVYHPDKITIDGDFKHIHYRESGCPYCRIEELEASKAKLGKELDKWRSRAVANRSKVEKLELIISGKTFCDAVKVTAERCAEIAENYTPKLNYGEATSIVDDVCEDIAEVIRKEFDLK